MTSDRSAAAAPPGRPEWGVADALVAAGILAAFAGLAAIDGGVVFREPLWLDEIHTVWVAERPRFRDVVSALHQGADFNPPLLFAWHWLIAQITGQVSPAALRLTALASVCGALLLTYRLLRRSFGSLPSLAGVASIGSGGLLLQHAFEGRFYGPWLLLAALYVTALTRLVDSNGSMRSQLAAGCSAALLCLIHYFGIITLTLTTAGVGVALLFRRRSPRILLPPLLSGLAALALTLPLLLGQKAALTGPVWITPACCLSSLVVYAESFVALPQVALTLVIAVLALLIPGLRRTAPATRSIESPDPALTGLVAMGLLPVVLIVIEVAGQPVLIDRYGLPTLLLLPPVIAAAVAPLRGFVQVACLLVIVGHGALAARRIQTYARDITTRRHEQVEAGRAAIQHARAMRTTVIVPRRFQLYPLLQALPAEAAPVFVLPLLDPETVRRTYPLASDSGAVGSLTLMEQDVARVHQRIFQRPALIRIDAAVDSACLLLLDEWNTPAFATRWLPRHRAKRLRPLLFVLQPADKAGAPRDCAGSTSVTSTRD